MWSFFIAVVMLRGVVQSVAGNEMSVNESPPYGYLVVSPKVLFAGKEETICATVQDSDEPVEITLIFMENNVTEISRAPPFNVEFGTACSIVEIPHVDEYPKTVILKATMKRLSAASSEWADQKKVAIFKQGSETYVQTDKPIYKPGQPVKFRVLTVDSDMKPDKTAPSDIWMETPSGIRVAQWLNQSSPDALIDLELPMSSDPPLGDWKLVVVRNDERIEKTFKVDEYVLPKFEITADLPPYIMTNAEEFEVRICARYTYGQPVRGSYSVDITIDEEYRSWYSRSGPRPVLRFESADTGVSGCGTIVVSGKDMQLNQSDFSIWSSTLKVDANFTEGATGVTLSETILSKRGIITTDPLLVTINAPDTFKPGLPFRVSVVVTYPDGTPAPGFDVKVNGQADYEDIYSGTFTSTEDGSVHFALENIDIDTTEVNLYATVEGFTNVSPSDSDGDYYDDDYYRYHHIYDPIGYHYAEAIYSPSGSFVQVEPVVGKLSPGEERVITTHFTADPETVADLKWVFAFMSRSKLLILPFTVVEETASRRKRDVPLYPVPFPDPKVNITQPGSLYSRKDSFMVTSEMSPVAKLLVYFIRPDQEVVADSITFDVEPVFDNKVSMSFANNEEAPGGKALLKLSASEGSLCAIGIVDKSVYVLEDDKDRITKDKVFQKIRADQDYHAYYWVPNRSDHCPDEHPWWFYSGLDRRRRKRTSVPYPGSYSRFEDSSQAFEDMGLLFISNMKVETRPCNTGGFPVLYDSIAPAPGADRAGVDIETGTAPTVRSFFPETWLWKLERIGDLGEAELDLDVPHTITDWVGNGFCLSAEAGLGVADTAALRAFQPFFVSLTLPYSIVREEEVGIKATVFNYLAKDCMKIRISLVESDMLVVVDNTYEHKVCICAQESKTVEFYVKGLALGEMDVEVHAVSVADDDLLCGNEVSLSEQTGVSDGVRRKLLVEPEGIQQEYSISKYFCPSELPYYSYNKRFQLPTPPNSVPGSMRGRMTLTGDLMGQTVNNLDNLLQIPTGCGEQNMLGFVPNIVAMQYFTESGTLTDDLEKRATTNMRTGYMRELNYRHKDGSYSAFGDSDDSGSTWLTAYVVRSFAQAARFIDLDQKDLDVTVDWLKRQQNDRGCFNRVGHLGHKAMAGGVNSEITLTAYVLTSMLIAGVAPEDPVIQSAQSCLERESDHLYDAYATAQLAYAGALAGHSRANAAINYLDAMAVREGDVLHWVSNRNDTADYDTYYRASKQSQEIEMTAYALLAYIQHMSPEDARVLGSPIVRWLVGQRSSGGGFSSTQDTVIGLQALAAYAGLLSRGPLKMRVELIERGRKVRQLELLEQNKLVMQEVDLAVPNLYTLRARGKGCGLVQFSVYYNTPPLTPPVAPFMLTKSSRNLDNDCKKFATTLCASYTGTGGANMVLAQVKLVTGFVADPASLNDLKSQTMMSKLKRVESDGKTLNFYIDQGLDDTPVCWDFVATKEFSVENAKPGTLNVFDYYEKDLAISDSLEYLCQPVEEEMPEPGKPGEAPVDPDITPPIPEESPLDPEVEVIPTGQPDEVDLPSTPSKPAEDVDGDSFIEKPDKPGKPVDDPSAKPKKPPFKPIVDPNAKPDKPVTAKPGEPPVVPEEEPTAKPDKPAVLEGEPTAKPEAPIVPEEEPTAKPDAPVVPEEEPTAKPDKPAVLEGEPTAKPEAPVVPEEEPTAKPDAPVVPEEEPTAKPDKPVVPEEEPTAKPDKPSVPEEEPTAKPDKPAVPEEEPTAKPEVPVVPEEEPTAKPDKPADLEGEPTAKPEAPVVPEAEPTANPDVPDVPEAEPTAKPDVPVVPEAEPTAKPDVPVVPEEEPTAKPDKPAVPEEEPTAKPDVPVVPEAEPTAKPDMPVVPEEEPTAKPDAPVVPEEEPTAKPDAPVVPEEEPTAKPDMPVVPEAEPTAKPDVPVVPEEEPTAKPEVPVVPEEEPTAKPDKPADLEGEPTAKPEAPVVPEAEPTAKPEAPVVPEAEPTAKPEAPVVPEAEPTAKPEAPVVPEAEPTAKPEAPVVPEAEPTAKPDAPVVPEAEPTAKPDAPVAPEEEPTAKPEAPVVPEAEPTAKPDAPVVPEEEPTAKPDAPVVPEEEPTAKPDAPVVPEAEPTAKPDAPVVPEAKPTAKPDAPVVPEEEPTAKPDAPVVPEEEPTAKPDAPVVPEEEPTAKPDAPVVPEEEPTAKPDATVVPEEEPTAKPEVPVVPEEEPTAKPDAPVVPEEEPTAKPDATVVPEEEPTAKPEVPVVPEEEPTAKPDAPVVPEEEPTAKPEVPVVPEEEPTAKPDAPVVPEEEPTAKPDVPVVPEEEPTAKPEAPVVPEAEPTAKPDAPVVPEAEPTAKPDAPVVPEAEPTAKPDAPVVPEEEPTAKPEAPVVPEAEPTAKPDAPVVPEEEPTAKPDAPVVPEEEPTAKPDAPVVPEAEPTAKPEVPVVPEEEPTAKPDAPVVPEEEPTAKPVVPEQPTVKPSELATTTTDHTAGSPVSTTEIQAPMVPTTPPTTTPTPVVIVDTMCTLYPDICDFGVCVDDETRPSFYDCDCYPGYAEVGGYCVPHPCSHGDVCGLNGDCVEDQSLPSAYRCDCELGYEEVGGTCVDVDECTYDESCPGSSMLCTNFPGTYECNCAEGYQEDSAGNCFACPICSDTLPSGFEESFCAADYVYGAKKRGDGSLRILIELRMTENRVGSTRYIVPSINPQCICDELEYGDRVLILTTMDKVDIVTLRRRTMETVDLAGAYIVPLKGSTKAQLIQARTSRCA